MESMNELTPDEQGMLVDAIHDSATVIHKGRRMNERIKLLWEEAAKTTQGDSWEEQTKFMERFAELIIRECINIGDNYEDILENEPECFNCRKVAYGIVDKIKQHFGVEE